MPYIPTLFTPEARNAILAVSYAMPNVAVEFSKNEAGDEGACIGPADPLNWWLFVEPDDLGTFLVSDWECEPLGNFKVSVLTKCLCSLMRATTQADYDAYMERMTSTLLGLLKQSAAA